MPICKVLVNDVQKNILKCSVNRELERGVDVATVVFPANVVPHENDDVKILIDNVDLTNCVGIYHFENTAKDESGYLHDGTNSGGSYIASKYGYGWTTGADNSTAYIEIPHNSDFNFGANGTHAVVFHVKLIASSTNRPLICKGTNNSVGDRAPLIFITKTGSTYGIGYRKSITGTTQESLDAPTDTIKLNTDHVVVCQFSPTIGMEIWIDGVRVAQSAGSTTAMFTNLDACRIGDTVGATGIGNAPWFVSDFCKFYTSTLSSSEIKSISNLNYISSTLKFGGKIWQINDKVTPRECQCKSYGKVIGETTIQPKVYNSSTITSIIQDLVETNTDLTFVLGASLASDVTLTQFVAQGALFDLLVSLASMLNKTFYTDGLGQFHLDDNQATNTGITYTNGVNSTIRESGFDDTELVNDVIVQGRDQIYRNQETFTGDGSTTTFTTAYIILDPYVTVDGTQMLAEQDYTINTLNRQLTFVNAPANSANIVVQYSYDSPITVHATDNTSITANGIRSKQLTAPWITTLGDATRFAQLYVSAFKDATPRYQVRIPFLEVQVDGNLIVYLVNSIKGLNAGFTIKSVTWEYPGITTLQCGEYSFQQFELHKKIVQELHSLQQLQNTNTSLVNYRNVQDPIVMVDTPTKNQLTIGHYNSNTYYSNYQVYGE